MSTSGTRQIFNPCARMYCYQLVTLLAILSSTIQADYVPGTPGAEWTKEELLIAKAKIRWIIHHPKAAVELIPGGEEMLAFYRNGTDRPDDGSDAIVPTAPKVVRITFHDCLKEVESGAGCNGCLNLDGVGAVYHYKPCRRMGNCQDFPQATDNNNLLWTALVLEEVYRNPSFGHPNLKPFPQSLFETGKSRADLWAYAGLVALQRSAGVNNNNCPKGKKAPCFNQVDQYSPTLYYDLPELKFRTGRKDCLPNSCTGEYAKLPFCTSAKEHHPNPLGNGQHVTRFFKEQFNMGPKEAVTLMGVHTLGHPMEIVSRFRHYPWTRRGDELNNDYFVNLVNGTKHFRFLDPRTLKSMHKYDLSQCELPVSGFIGDEYGNPADATYRIKSEQRSTNNGPWNWNLYARGCSRAVCAKIKGDYALNSCCHHLEQCISGDGACPKAPFDCDVDGRGCPMNVFQKFSMLSVDMGLYLNFDIDQDGRPQGCEGMDSEAWLSNRYKYSGDVKCPLNTMRVDKHRTMADLVLEFANDNEAWINEFVKVFDKMLQNGYGSLPTIAPNEWFHAKCRDGQFICLE